MVTRRKPARCTKPGSLAGLFRSRLSVAPPTRYRLGMDLFWGKIAWVVAVVAAIAAIWYFKGNRKGPRGGD
jgi:hypothetical protein